MTTVVAISDSVGGRSSMRTPSPLAARDRSDGCVGGDSNSCYYPGCRKDTNCHCEMCLASIHATLDLIPSAHKSSITHLSASRPASRRPPSPSHPSTPPRSPGTGSTLSGPVSPPVHSTAKSRPPEKPVKKERSCGLGYWVVRMVLGLCLFWVIDYGIAAVISGNFEPKLAADAVMRIGDESQFVSRDLRERLRFLEQRIEEFVGERISNCSSPDSNWELNQGGQLFFHWRCVIYKSMAEEVNVWGSPLLSSGLLTTGLTPRSLTILSGRIIEWSGGKLTSTLRTSNSSSWTCGKWTAAVALVDPNTWVLEYRRSALLQGSGLLQAVWEVVKMRASRRVQELKHKPWRALLDHRLPKSYHHTLKQRIHPT